MIDAHALIRIAAGPPDDRFARLRRQSIIASRSLEIRNWKLEFGNWKLEMEFGNSKLESGKWKVEWHLSATVAITSRVVKFDYGEDNVIVAILYGSKYSV